MWNLQSIVEGQERREPDRIIATAWVRLLVRLFIHRRLHLMNEKALRVRYQKNKVKKERWKMYDVIIIGAGVSGAAAARELSRYNAKICVIEKEEDVCCGTSKANSAIVHAGYDAKEGSLMAKLNVRGNAMMEQLSKELDFPFQRIGSLVVCRDEADMPNLKSAV